MVKLSVVIITLNEENRISRCLESVQSFADEILIVDSYSTDKTEEIAESFGATFIPNAFKGHIEQKNFGLTKAKYDYVLSLDADEALDANAQKAVKEAKENWKYDSYAFNRLTNYCGQWIRHCGWYPDRKIRLFNRRTAQWGGVNPHDKIELSPEASNQRLSGNILHYSFPTISSHVKTANNFSEIAAKATFQRKKKIYFVVHIILNPLFTFCKKYFFQLGFLDGFYGLVICIISSHANFLKYSKIWQLKSENNRIKNG